jgi:hypothetical protein
MPVLGGKHQLPQMLQFIINGNDEIKLEIIYLIIIATCPCPRSGAGVPVLGVVLVSPT